MGPRVSDDTRVPLDGRLELHVKRGVGTTAVQFLEVLMEITKAVTKPPVGGSIVMLKFPFVSVVVLATSELLIPHRNWTGVSVHKIQC